jgi:hypothetical protein
MPTAPSFRPHFRLTCEALTRLCVRLAIRPKGAFFKLLVQDKRVGGKTIRGTTDWIKHTILCEISKDTHYLDIGFSFHGGGKPWIDMDSLQYDIIDDAAR